MSIFLENDIKREIVGNTINFNADCAEVIKNIKDGSIDFICTDAPYVISQKTNFHIGGAWNNKEDARKRKTAVNYDFGDWDKKDLNLDILFNQFHRILRDGGTVLFFYDIYKMQELKHFAEKNKFKQPRLCLWQKTNPVPVNSKKNYLSNSREAFMTFVKKSKPTFNSEYDNGYYVYPICGGKERTKHTTQKPLVLMEELVRKHSNENDVVLDCFSGSNTTGEACMNLNRRYVGVEQNEEYFNIGIDRLKNKLN